MYVTWCRFCSPRKGLFSYIDGTYSNAHFAFNAADFVEYIIKSKEYIIKI